MCEAFLRIKAKDKSDTRLLSILEQDKINQIEVLNFEIL
jgi:hypothetical protein